jgi:hypothetical protein
LLFRSEEAIEQWCSANRYPQGEILTVEQTWALSRLWYHNRMSIEYHGRSIAQIEAIFRQLGLASSFWYLDENEHKP